MRLSDLWRKLVDTKPVSKGITPRAEQILKAAKVEAEKMGHAGCTVTHLAIALIEFNQGCASNVLKRFGMDPVRLRQAVVAQPSSVSMEDVLPISESERVYLHHPYLGSEHLLLGLLRHGENALARCLKEQSIDLEVARQEVLKELDPNYRAGND